MLNNEEKLILLHELLSSPNLTFDTSESVKIGEYTIFISSYKSQNDTFLIFYGLDLICEVRSDEISKLKFHLALNKRKIVNENDKNVGTWTIEKHLSKISELNDDV